MPGVPVKRPDRQIATARRRFIGRRCLIAMALAKHLLCASMLLALAPGSAYGKLFHVDARRGDDLRDGLSPANAFRSIQRAADVVAAGDEVVIGRGVYFDRVRVRGKRGTPGKPIIFRADAIEKGRVVVTNANPDIRRGVVSWRLEDEELRLYSIPFKDGVPDRVLYSGTDLFPYGSLEALKRFAGASGPLPRHGRYLDETRDRLYVRLHPSLLYGPTDPNHHVMSVSPNGGFGFSILSPGNAHIVVEGITFETPGDSAVFTEGSFVDVRRCWFLGCPYAVRGTRKAKPPGDGVDATASNVSLSFCDFSEAPTFADAEELLRDAELSHHNRGDWSLFWHRKHSGSYGLPSNVKNYENGIATAIGDQWDIHHNYIHDAFEGLANDGLNWATGLHFHNNDIVRLCDNAIEVEDHARDVHIYCNRISDVLEPFSYQPLSGPPWPGPVYFYRNIIANTPQHSDIWRHALPEGNRGAFKIGISLKNWRDGHCNGVPKAPLSVPAPGLAIYNNTVCFSGGRLITLLGDRSVPIKGVVFARNIFFSDVAIAENSTSELQPGHFEFRDNVSVTPPGRTGIAESQVTAGDGGAIVGHARALGWRDAESQDFSFEDDSLIRRVSRRADHAPMYFGDIGAIQSNDLAPPLKTGPLAASSTSFSRKSTEFAARASTAVESASLKHE